MTYPFQDPRDCVYGLPAFHLFCMCDRVGAVEHRAIFLMLIESVTHSAPVPRDKARVQCSHYTAVSNSRFPFSKISEARGLMRRN